MLKGISPLLSPELLKVLAEMGHGDELVIGDANLLVMPNIDAANISYNLLKTAAGGNIAIGPVLLGAAQPVHILTASATVRRIVNMTALTVADANAARYQLQIKLYLEEE